MGLASILTGCGPSGDNTSQTESKNEVFKEKDVLEFLQTDLFKQNNHYFLKVCLGSKEQGYFEYFSSKSGRLLSPVLTNKMGTVNIIECDLANPHKYKNINDLIKHIGAGGAK